MTESVTTKTKTFKVLGLPIWESKTVNVSESPLSKKKFLEELSQKIAPLVKNEVSKKIVEEVKAANQ